MSQDRPAAVRSTRRSLPIALLRAREAVMAPIREMLAESPVNEQKWRVLRVLDESGPLEQKAIAAEACLLLPSLTRMLQSMEAEGLVSRESDPGDRRRSIVSITDAGRAVIEAHADESNAILRRVEERLGAERLEALLGLLDELRHIDLEPPRQG
jgi:homoprotocatechuate degradation regulator HpaR